MTAFLLEPGEEMRLEDVRIENVRVHGEGQRELARLKPVVNQYMQTKVPGHVRGCSLQERGGLWRAGPLPHSTGRRRCATPGAGCHARKGQGARPGLEGRLTQPECRPAGRRRSLCSLTARNVREQGGGPEAQSVRSRARSCVAGNKPLASAGRRVTNSIRFQPERSKR